RAFGSRGGTAPGGGWPRGDRHQNPSPRRGEGRPAPGRAVDRAAPGQHHSRCVRKRFGHRSFRRVGVVPKSVIYHNPRCSTSRKTLDLLRDNGIEPEAVQYLKTPPTRAELVKMIKDAGIDVRTAVRKRE